MKKVLVLFHAGCIDGFTAAWAASKALGDSAEYVGVQHGQPPPDVEGRDVFIVDFSYDRETVLAMKASANSLHIYDHHKTARDALEGLSFATFDMNRSGAGITWDEIAGSTLPRNHDVIYGTRRPWLVDYVEDRDLWRFDLPRSKAVNAYIGACPQSFEQWDAISRMALRDVANAGEAVLMFVDRYVGEMSRQAIERKFCGYLVPVVNAPYINTSELVGHLAKTYPFAVGWYQRSDGLYAYSLRSRGEFDVSDIAKRFGGGGHKNAAGFQSTERVDLCTPD